MKKKLLIVLTAISIFVWNSQNCLAAEGTCMELDAGAYFTISEGVETAETSFGISGGNIGVAYGVFDLFEDSPYQKGIAQNGETVAIHPKAFERKLYYQASSGYQNAQCLVDGVLINSGEITPNWNSICTPTQIVCTAEKIEETPPDEPDEPDTPEGQNSSVDFNLNISEMLEITGLPSTINLDIDSSNFDELATTTLNLSTASNYAYGYIFTLLTDSTNLTDNTTSATIPTLASGTYTDANFTTNRWGFSLDSTNFRPIATTNTLYSTTAPSISTPTTITLGLKLDATQPAGTYSTVLNFALTPNIVTE